MADKTPADVETHLKEVFQDSAAQSKGGLLKINPSAVVSDNRSGAVDALKACIGPVPGTPVIFSHTNGVGIMLSKLTPEMMERLCEFDAATIIKPADKKVESTPARQSAQPTAEIPLVREQDALGALRESTGVSWVFKMLGNTPAYCAQGRFSDIANLATKVRSALASKSGEAVPFFGAHQEVALPVASITPGNIQGLNDNATTLKAAFSNARC